MVYLMPLVWVIFAGVLANSGGMMHRERVLGREERRATWVYALIVMLPLIFLAGMRSSYFVDTYGYVKGYLALPDLFSEKMAYIQSLTKDAGFYTFEVLVSMIAPGRARVFLMLVAIIQGFCIMKTYRRYSEDYWFAIFVFVATTDIYSWMYNGIRQFMAVALIFGASGWIFRKKYIRAILAICFASLFHKSALMMIPVIFFVQGKPWNWKMLLILAGTLVAMRFSSSFTRLLDSALVDTQYSTVVSDWTRWGDDGTNPLRALVYSVPTIISLFCRKKIQQSGDRVIQVACNMGIVTTALYLVSMVTSGIFMGRQPIYCSLYANGILLPWELKHVCGKTVRTVAILCYMLFFFVQMRYGWGLI